MENIPGMIWALFGFILGAILASILNSHQRKEELNLIIRTGGGCVWAVEGLPDGWTYEVIDEEDDE
jgi:hypothetical protein